MRDSSGVDFNHIERTSAAISLHESQTPQGSGVAHSRNQRLGQNPRAVVCQRRARRKKYMHARRDYCESHSAKFRDVPADKIAERCGRHLRAMT